MKASNGNVAGLVSACLNQDISIAEHRILDRRVQMIRLTKIVRAFRKMAAEHELWIAEFFRIWVRRTSAN